MQARSEPPPAATEERQAMKINVHVWKDRLILAGPRVVLPACSRPAVTLLIGTQGELSVVSEAGQEYRGRALLVAPNLSRAVSAPQGCYSLNLDPVHRYCRFLRQTWLADQAVASLDARLDEHTLALAASTVGADRDCGDSYRISEAVLAALFPEAAGQQPIDPRIDMVATWLRTHVPKQLPLALLAELSGLSESRLTHLFTAELALSPRRYLLWVKMRRAAELLVDNRSVTEVAHVVGFADSAHLSRAIKSYFAITPSVFANPALVRFSVCDSLWSTEAAAHAASPLVGSQQVHTKAAAVFIQADSRSA